MIGAAVNVVGNLVGTMINNLYQRYLATNHRREVMKNIRGDLEVQFYKHHVLIYVDAQASRPIHYQYQDVIRIDNRLIEGVNVRTVVFGSGHVDMREPLGKKDYKFSECANRRKPSWGSRLKRILLNRSIPVRIDFAQRDPASVDYTEDELLAIRAYIAALDLRLAALQGTR